MSQGCLRIFARASALGAVIAIGASLTATAATSQPSQLAPLAADSSVQQYVAAAAGWTVWSDLVGGKYVLESRDAKGTVAPVPGVPASTVPFRVALARRSTGQLLAAYDACPAAKPQRAGATPTLGQRCRIILVDVVTGKQRTLPLARHTTSNALPALSRDTLAFVAQSGKTAKVMTMPLAGGAATTRWSGAVGHGNGPVQLAIDGKAVAAIWSQSQGNEQRVDAQTRPGAKVVKLAVGGDDLSCCQTDHFLSLAFVNASVLSVLDTTADDDGDIGWSVERLGLTKTVKPAAGPSDTASGEGALAVTAVALAEDANRTIVLAANATRPYGVYAYTP